MKLIDEYDNSGNAITEYVYFGLRPVTVKTGGNINIVHTDYLSTPRVVTSGGSVMWQWKNDNPYGNNQAQGSIEFNLRFAGQYYDYESGLHYNIHRTYDPQIGRYMQSNPIGLAGGSNTYNYVNRNPLDGVDPDGHNPLVIAGIGALAGGLSNGLNYYSQGQSFKSGFINGFIVGGSAALIPSAWIGGAIGGIGTQLLNRYKDDVKLFDSGHPATDCALEVFFTGTVGGLFGKWFNNISEGKIVASTNKYIRENLDSFNAAISNGYTFYYSNMINLFTNVPGALK